MNLKRILSAVLCAAMLMTPMASFAEDMGYYAGEVTTESFLDDYYAGEQLDLTATLSLMTKNGLPGEAIAYMFSQDPENPNRQILALDEMLKDVTIEMSFYDDYGTARVTGALMLGEAPLVSGAALVFEDGSVKAMTSLTGNYVLTMPAGTIQPGESEGFDLFSLMYGDVDMPDVDESVPFEELPAGERLRYTATEALVTVFGHLLGWVSGTQRATGELYVFDDTYIEATDVRDGVAQRMIGNIRTKDFTKLLWNIVTTMRDDAGDFQRALADYLAEMGVTRYQVRQFVDGLLTEETIDPALDWVQLSHNIKDDGALCELDDISYTFKRLRKSVEKIWFESTDETMQMIISYDDWGGVVGFDAYVPKITESWPFEGSFEYAIRTDDYWQSVHTVLGDLQVYGNNRVVGELRAKNGEDVDGVNENYLVGHLDIIDQDDGSSVGFGVDARLDFAADGEYGAQSETFNGSAAVQVRVDGDAMEMGAAYVDGKTAVGENGVVVQAVAGVDVMGIMGIAANVTLARGEFDELVFADGQEIDMSAMTEAEIQLLREAVVEGIGQLSRSLAKNPKFMVNALMLMAGGDTTEAE